MYSITYGDDLLYDPLDADAYPVSDVSLSAEINGSGSCEFSITKTHPLYDVIDLYDTDRLVTVTEDSHILFKGYVASVDEDEYGMRTYSCTGILSFLKKSVVRPYSTDAEDEKHVKAPSTIDGFFNWLISEHDNHTDRRKRFIVGRNEGDIVRRENVVHASSDSASTTADVLQSELLDGLGGYVFVRYGDDGVTYLDYLSECRDTNAQIIDFGVNLVSYSRTDDATDVATVCYAKGGTPEKDEGSDKEKPPVDLTKYPDGPFARGSYRFEKSGDRIICLDLVDKYGYSEMTFEDSDLLDPYELLDSAAIALLKQLEPKVTIDIRAIDLSLFMDGYEPLRCGELVRVRSDPNGFDSYMLVSGMDLDLESPENTEYTLGTTFDAFTGESNKIIRQLNATINKSVDQVTALDQTTKDQAIQIGKVEDVANNASDKADNAQNTANNAQNAADNAQNTANNAQQTANSNKQSIADIEKQQSEQDKLLEQMQQGVEQAEQEIDAINDRIEQMDSDASQIQANIDAVRQEAQTNFETAKAAADSAGKRADAAQAAVDALRESTSSELQNVKQSVSKVQSDVESVSKKAEDLASDLDGTKATVEQVTTDLGEVKTTVSNAATKADQALQVSTSASQTATEAKTTATSAYQDAQSALTQSSTASQTANAVKTELETNYSTTDEIAEQYATKSLVEQTSQSITSTVEATYATKATVEALENIANNAVQTWMGSGVPTLSNKPASDWNTAELKSQHSGDIYYDTDTGYSYRFGSSDGKNYSWSLIKDTDISKAVADAAKAQQTAEGVSDEVTQLKTDIPATYATKTEVKQTTDSIKSTVSEVATTANSALSKATTVEQTAKGLQTTVTEQAEKLDGAVTTISQVSQRVDSVSSTITQVSGRVDDVEDKADAAQGTANSAMSQASRVEQSLDSFKTSVSRDYQTKTDALSQKSELEQNINSFKTTVSETYTTKDEFNALEIGGTNLIRNSDFSNGTSNWTAGDGNSGLKSVTDDVYGHHAEFSAVNGGRIYSHTSNVWEKGQVYAYSFYAKASANGARIQPSQSISYWGSTHSLTTEWKRYTGTITCGATNTTGTLSFSTRDSATYYITRVKLEKGTKPTAWSPAPEDFDGKYTSKTEFKQTTDKISATATAASQNASSALSKVSSLEVSVDGIDTRVEEVASNADEAVKTASQVSQRVDSLSSTITQVQGDVDRIDANSQNFITNPQFKSGNADGVLNTNMNATDSNPGALPGTATTFGKNSGGYDNRAENVKIKFIKNHTYRIEIDARLASDNAYTGGEGLGLFFWFMTADNPGLSKDQYTGFNANLIPHGTKEWTHASYDYTPTMGDDDPRIIFRPAYRVAPSSRWLVTNFTCTDVTAIAEAQKDADTANSTANSALSKSSSVEQNLNSFKTSVSQTYETKSDALNKQSSLQQSVNNLRTEVSEKYTTKTDFTNLNNAATKTYQFHANNNNQTGWYKLGTWSNTQQSDVCAITIYAGTGQNGRPDQNREVRVFIKNGWQSTPSASGAFGVTIDRIRNADNAEVQVRATADNSCDVWYKGDTNYAAGRYTISIDPSSKWTHSGSFTTSAPSSGTLQTQEYQTYSTKSYVDQTSRTVSLGVVEEYKNGQHGSALATQSDITAAKDSITSTVSQTYLSKNDATNTYLNKNTAASTYATKTEVKQTSDSLTVTISSAVSKAESAAEAAADAQNTANSAKKQTYNTVNASWGTAGYFRFATLKITGAYANRPIYFSLSNRGQKASNVWVQFNNVNSTDPSLNYIQADGGMNVWIHKTATSTWEMIAQKSEAYDTLIVDDYSNANSITVTWVNGFLSSIPSGSTQATRLASKRPSSDIDKAQSTANTANTNATNANNRVGNLETCIKMTSDGVRVGKISNGNFVGVSALVNSAGSFDILNQSGETLTSFDRNGIRLFYNNKAYRVMNVTMSRSTPLVSAGMINESTQIPVSGFTSSGEYMHLYGEKVLWLHGDEISTVGVNSMNISVPTIRINNKGGKTILNNAHIFSGSSPYELEHGSYVKAPISNTENGTRSELSVASLSVNKMGPAAVRTVVNNTEIYGIRLQNPGTYLVLGNIHVRTTVANLRIGVHAFRSGSWVTLDQPMVIETADTWQNRAYPGSIVECYADDILVFRSTNTLRSGNYSSMTIIYLGPRMLS